MTKHKVFVYGTLRPHDNAGNLIPATHYLMWYEMMDVGRFPYINYSAGNDDDLVYGNIIETDDAGLHAYDAYEGAPSFYTRVDETAFKIDDGDDKGVDVQVYVGKEVKERGGKLIPSGNWEDRHAA